MDTDAGLDNVVSAFRQEIPRMMSDSDIGVVRTLASRLPKRARIVEIGPWLGGVSVHLAQFGELHVIDRFIWTEKNAERLPGVAEPGMSFRSVFESILKDHDARAEIHTADFRDFTWDRGPVDYYFIDAPRNAGDLLACLIPLAKSLHQDSLVVVKNGLNPAHFGMVSLIEVLLSQSIFDLVTVDQPKWCNIACLKSGAKFARIHSLNFDDDFFDRNPLNPGIKDPWGGGLFPIARLAQHIDALDWDMAYDQLDRLAPDIENIYAWDEQEPFLDLPGDEKLKLATFAEALSLHNEPTTARKTRIPFEKSPALALRAYWKGNLGKPWRSRDLSPALIESAFRKGCLHWPARLQSHVQGRAILEIGTGLALAGIGYMVAGAGSYLGIETQPELGLAPDAAVAAHADDLPDWLAAALSGLDQPFRLVRFGAPLHGLDVCLLHSHDPRSVQFADALAGALAANAPKIEQFQIPSDHRDAVVSGVTE